MVKSRFKFWSLLAIISSLLLLGVLIYFVFKFGIMNLPLYATIPLFVLLILCVVWLLFGEIRTKLVKVNVEGDTITVKNFIGFGIEKKYYFKELRGYKISMLPSEYQEYEYLYLLLKERKAIKISQFYHSNYVEIKQAIIRKTKSLGTEHFSLVREVKEIFMA
jgi:hypothetical protein